MAGVVSDHLKEMKGATLCVTWTPKSHHMGRGDRLTAAGM